MLPHPEAISHGALLLSVDGSLDALRKFTAERGLAGQGDQWGEVVRTYSDDHSYIDFTAHRAAGMPRVLIEFGMQEQGERRTRGFFDAFWDPASSDFLRIESAGIDGVPVDVDALVYRLTPHLALPLVSTDSSQMDSEG